MVFDVIVLIVLLVSALIAFLRGAIREMLTILGVVGGMAAAWYAGPLLIPHMEGWLGVQEGVEPEKLLGVLPYDILAKISRRWFQEACSPSPARFARHRKRFCCP